MIIILSIILLVTVTIIAGLLGKIQADKDHIQLLNDFRAIDKMYSNHNNDEYAKYRSWEKEVNPIGANHD